MGYLLALITSLLALFFGYSLYVKKRSLHPEERLEADLKGSINALITDFNRVSNININILEEKIKDLHEVVALADEKIKRLNGLMADLEILTTRVEKSNKNLSATNATRQYRRIRKLTTNHPVITKELDIDSKDELILDKGRLH